MQGVSSEPVVVYVRFCRNLCAIPVKLTIAHADHNPANMDDRNLRSWCTWCHLHHDQPHHKETRCRKKDASRPILLQASLASIR
jgi:hypothetical protein